MFRQQRCREILLHARLCRPLSMALVFVVLGSASCMQPVKPGETRTPAVLNRTKKKPTTVESPPLESNIVRVSKFFKDEPWLSFEDDGSGRINGFRCAVYLEGAGQPKGVFGTGTIVVAMYRIDYDPLGREIATPLQEWELSAEKAYPWRSKTRTLLGYGYGLRLRWDDKHDLRGKQVAFIVRYIRDDGRVISSTRQILKVPLRGHRIANPQNQGITATDQAGLQ